MQYKPTKPGREHWTLERLDATKVSAEKEYIHYTAYTPGQRIAFGEELRLTAYGPEQINARIQRVFERAQR